MNSDGANRKSLIPYDGNTRHSPRWSPDNKYILYGEGEIGKADSVIIQNWFTKRKRILKTPKGNNGWITNSFCWMGNNHVLIAAYEYADGNQLKKKPHIPFINITSHQISLQNSQRVNGMIFIQIGLMIPSYQLPPLRRKKPLGVQ